MLQAEKTRTKALKWKRGTAGSGNIKDHSGPSGVKEKEV
jgi:hypothetical protein